MKSLTSRIPQSTQTRRIILAAFLIFSLIGVTLPTDVQAESYSGSYHVVKKGETLRNIAIAYGTTVYALAHANGLHDVNRIEVGQHLYIPNHKGYYPPPTQPQSSSCARYHTVKKGESLSGIAQWYGVDTYKLAKANHIYDLNHVYYGQKLCVPGASVKQPTYKQPTYQQPVYPKPQYHKPVYQYPTPTPYAPPVPHSQYAPENAPFNYDPWAKGHDGYNHHPHYKPQPPSYQHYYPTPTPVPPTPTPVTRHYGDHGGHHGGWTGAYYANTQCAGTPVFTRHDPEINFEWGYGGPGGGLWNDMFSVEWTTKAHFSEGDYKFFALSDDGVRVYVDNQLVIDGWKEQGPTEYVSRVWLGEGYHHVKVQYYEQTHSATIKFHWARW